MKFISNNDITDPTLNLAMEDKDHQRLVEAKGSMTWYDFIMQLAKTKER